MGLFYELKIMRRQKSLTTQTELDTRLLNYCLLPKEGKRAESSKRVEMNGRSNIFVSVSARKHFPVYLLLSRRLFNLGCYSSEELETNSEIKLKKYANKTWLTYQDLVFFAQEIQNLKYKWGYLSRDAVIKYHDSLPDKDVVFTIEKVRDIFIRCAKCLPRCKKNKPKILLKTRIFRKISRTAERSAIC